MCCSLFHITGHVYLIQKEKKIQAVLCTMIRKRVFCQISQINSLYNIHLYAHKYIKVPYKQSLQYTQTVMTFSHL